MKKVSLTFILAASLALVPFAQAQLIDVQYAPSGAPTQSGAAILGGSNDFWNNLQGSYSATDLRDSAKHATSIDGLGSINLTVTPGTPTDYYGENNAPESTPGNTSYDSATANLMQSDYFDYVSTTSTITGLTSGDSFKLVVYASGNLQGQGDNLTLNGAIGGAQTAATTGNDRMLSNGIGDAFQTFTGTIDSGGTLSLQDSTLGASAGYVSEINGFQLDIATVPEPSTWAMVLGGLASLIVLRRFGRKSA